MAEKEEGPIIDNETGSLKVKEKKEQQPTGNETKGNVTKVKEKMKMKPQVVEETVTKVDLNKPIQEEDNTFDAVMCVGTFTFGHVKPPALDEFIRITKNKGLICFTINEGIHEEYGFDKKIAQLNKDNKWKEIEFFKSDYIASKDVNAWLGLYEVIK